ncbi:energy transducer TonB [Ralstonia insidiosa]|uniref:TonB C-terminal domain-containing protein n=1 Tax=Ralstonia insidiosa TaxID=190721 RepID=A0A848P4J2_9RALS|nr:energy transducer TonB [Ralstonia insidiosa]NMV40449.1 TonB C-terminal domain-containing protein [Ralstonia insidiosa]
MPLHTRCSRLATSLVLATQLAALAGCTTSPPSEPGTATTLSEAESAEIRQRLDAMADTQMAADAAALRQSMSPSTIAASAAAYAERVRRKVRSNIVFDDTGIVGNPSAVVAVSLAPDGSVLQRKLMQSSGNQKYDAAVLRAIASSDPFPRASNGRAPARLTLTFRPKNE